VLPIHISISKLAALDEIQTFIFFFFFLFRYML
jgi:hypothetical protein